MSAGYQGCCGLPRLLGSTPLDMQVVIGVGDSNPLVNGTGAKTLLDAGIITEYVRGEEESLCFDMNRDFFACMQQGA